MGLAISALGFTQLTEAENELVENCLQYADKKEKTDSGSQLYIWMSFKWYEGFTKVAALLNALETVDVNEALLNALETVDVNEYLYICIGEDDSDTTTRGGLWDNEFGLGYVREIRWNNKDE